MQKYSTKGRVVISRQISAQLVEMRIVVNKRLQGFSRSKGKGVATERGLGDGQGISAWSPMIFCPSMRISEHCRVWLEKQ